MHPRRTGSHAYLQRIPSPVIGRRYVRFFLNFFHFRGVFGLKSESSSSCGWMGRSEEKIVCGICARSTCRESHKGCCGYFPSPPIQSILSVLSLRTIHYLVASCWFHRMSAMRTSFPVLGVQVRGAGSGVGWSYPVWQIGSTVLGSEDRRGRASPTALPVSVHGDSIMHYWDFSSGHYAA